MIHSLDLCDSFISALRGETEKIVPWVANGLLESSSVLGAAMASAFTIYHQVLLARGEYSKLAARKESMEKQFLGSRVVYVMPAIYLEIQLAAAFSHLGKEQEAEAALKKAAELAFVDRIYMPFVENMDQIPAKLWKTFLDVPAYQDDLRQIAGICGRYKGARDRQTGIGIHQQPGDCQTPVPDRKHSEDPHEKHLCKAGDRRQQPR